jgi:hypothetical protein
MEVLQLTGEAGVLADSDGKVAVRSRGRACLQ